MTEHDPNPEAGLNYKNLRLISPPHANNLDVPAEAPVFISPMTNQENVCAACETIYGPLVYPQGRTVQSHHFHKDGGGIYYYHVSDNESLPRGSNHWGWLAIINPEGIVEIDDFDFRRCGKVTFKEVAAFCLGCRKPVNEGFAQPDIAELNAGHKSPNLVPYCLDCWQNNVPRLRPEPRYSFIISEKFVRFSEETEY